VNFKQTLNVSVIWAGNSRWVQAMEWSGQKEFGASGAVPFLVDGAEAGTLKSHGPLAFLKVCVEGFIAMREIVNSLLVTLFFC